MTKERQALLQVLADIQNDASNWSRDIMTITGCGMSDDEVRTHIAKEFELVVRRIKERAAQPKRAPRKMKQAA